MKGPDEDPWYCGDGCAERMLEDATERDDDAGITKGYLLFELYVCVCLRHVMRGRKGESVATVCQRFEITASSSGICLAPAPKVVLGDLELEEPAAMPFPPLEAALPERAHCLLLCASVRVISVHAVAIGPCWLLCDAL